MILCGQLYSHSEPWSSQLSEKQFLVWEPMYHLNRNQGVSAHWKINDFMEKEEKGILYKSSYSHHPK